MTDTINPPAGTPEDTGAHILLPTDTPSVRVTAIRSASIENVILILCATVGWLHYDKMDTTSWMMFTGAIVGLVAAAKALGGKWPGSPGQLLALIGVGTIARAALAAALAASMLLVGCAGGMPSPADARAYANEAGTLLDAIGDNTKALCKVPVVEATPEAAERCEVFGDLYDKLVALYKAAPL